MDNEGNKKFESVYSKKVRAGKRRTYFFDVRKTKGEDFYITLTESTKKFNSQGYERHKIFLYKEDFNRFCEGLNDAITHVKEELMPDFDYEEYDRRQEEWEASVLAEQNEQAKEAAEAPKPAIEATDETPKPPTEDTDTDTDSEEDISW